MVDHKGRCQLLLSICRTEKNKSTKRNKDIHTYVFVISPNNRPGTSDRKEIEVVANTPGEAKRKAEAMYPGAFFYGGVRIKN